MNLEHLGVEELQRLARLGDTAALRALGVKVMDLDFCLSDLRYCKHLQELIELKFDIENQIPPECPKCGNWLTNI